MSIDVICPGCLKRFQVSDQFAGRSGPCPGCKTIIAIPKPEDQVIIEEPEYKTGSPGAHTKIDGISRRPGFFQRFEVILLCSLFSATAIIAILANVLKDSTVASLTPTTAILFGVGLILLSLGSSVLGYGILKSSEITAFSRRKTILRSAFTALIYLIFVSAFIAVTLILPHSDPSRTMILFVVGIASFAIASFAPMALFEMEITQGILHVAVMICMTSLFCLLANNLQQWLLAP